MLAKACLLKEMQISTTNITPNQISTKPNFNQTKTQKRELLVCWQHKSFIYLEAKDLDYPQLKHQS